MANKSKNSEDENPERELERLPEFFEEERIERELVFQPEFLEDLTYWVETNRKIALRALSLVKEISRNPFQGTGKPEPLRYQGANVWSRRLTEADRIVYIVSDDQINFIQARYHYSER